MDGGAGNPSGGDSNRTVSTVCSTVTRFCTDIKGGSGRNSALPFLRATGRGRASRNNAAA